MLQSGAMDQPNRLRDFSDASVVSQFEKLPS